jgi:hypothetical protein
VFAIWLSAGGTARNLRLTGACFKACGLDIKRQLTSALADTKNPFVAITFIDFVQAKAFSFLAVCCQILAALRLPHGCALVPPPDDLPDIT